jgi:CRISPR-associated protein Cmr3
MIVELTARDPLIARDGRPFNAGNRMRPVGWFYPSVVAGSVRTSAGKALGRFVPDELRKIEVAGCFPCRHGRLYLPTPKDCVLREDPAACLPLSPRPSLAVRCNLPGGLAPCLLPEEVTEDFKPAKPPSFVSQDALAGWLVDQQWTYPFKVEQALEPAMPAERMHVKIEASRLAAEEGQLYMTVGQELDPETTLQIRVHPDSVLLPVHSLGGERRLAFWQSRDTAAEGWDCPDEISRALGDCGKLVRMVLATPALFSSGWAPGWLLKGEPVPGTKVELQLIGACVDRGQPVSGWSLEAGRRGPKPSRRMAPAGSVYFCKVKNGNPGDLAGRWLQPVSDEEQDRRDGFGLAVWGVWKLAQGEVIE